MIQLHNNLPTDWTRVVPDTKNIIHLHLFDDGNEKYKQYENEWVLFGKWKGKIALFNAFDENVTIYSISEWKTSNNE
tara:strand:- start:133 stop:363 length:231 start_codon:yes stop_codon:yes gene_type:complete